ncbi:uncharacterized protein N7515_000470 [Penicillium bovifimosum]|uniref:Alpha-1,3-mannosyltransferase n=1 Tax=Penicillium bovifimosum TaxID=126998 RepID=A0A9W9HFM8_9EURO|nr:uncharacterized protein N7515_000470 [Penicillium bovifimosum]KAJ5145906.1 hypothetical protein N7515_000470 [Penicillium bovifimosum]
MFDSYLPQHSTPLKEGRSHPPCPRLKVRRKGMALRTIHLVFAAAAGWLIVSCFFFWTDSSTSDAKGTRTAFGMAKDRLWQIHPAIVRAADVWWQDSTSQNMSEESIATSPVETQANVESASIKDKDSQKSVSKASKYTNNNTESRHIFPGDFDRALDYLFSIIPDEMYLRELLRPVIGTGAEKLRELGLRTRAYKHFFEAWEKLHLVIEDNGNTYVRDDLIPYIRAKFSEQTFPEALHKYETYRHFIAKFSALLFPWTSPYFGDHMSLHASSHHGGRGIVFTAGDNHAAFLLAAIPSLRTLGCELPVEIMYLGDSDLGEDFRAELEALPGVVTRDLSAMVSDEGWRLTGWAGKPFSILFSSFREVILIDADSLFFVNPEVLFEDEDYVRTGALFFKDRMIMPESKKRWLQQILPKPISKQVRQSRMWTGESGHMQESGVVVVDKWTHFVALLLVSRMNGPDRDGDKKAGIVGTYDMVYGDKETFWIGWELAGDTSYAFHPGAAGTMGVIQDPDNFNPTNDLPSSNFDRGLAATVTERHRKMAPGHESDLTICAPQLLHLDRDKRPLWFNGWLYKNKYSPTERTIGEFDVFMEEPKEVLDPGAWQLEENNMCCLSNAATRQFTKEETEWLGELIKMAKMKEN